MLFHAKAQSERKGAKPACRQAGKPVFPAPLREINYHQTRKDFLFLTVNF